MSKKVKAEVVEFVVKENNFFRNCKSQLEKMNGKINKTQWELVNLIAKHVNSPTFKATFLNHANYAESMGLKREFVTKAVKESYYGLLETNLIVGDHLDSPKATVADMFTVSQVNEIMSLEPDKAVKAINDFTLTPIMTQKELREAVKGIEQKAVKGIEQKKDDTKEENSADEDAAEESTTEESTTEENVEDERLTMGIDEFYSIYGTVIKDTPVITLYVLKDILADYVSITIQ